MHYLSVCAILKNEGRYLREWIEFYIKQGVEHFYLYDNESTDNSRDDLCDFEALITWHKVKGTAQQRFAYNHAVQNYQRETEWCAFLDVDEFLYSGRYEIESTGFLSGAVEKKLLSLKDTIEESYDNDIIAGIAVHWLLFGSSGHLEYSDEPVTRRFTRRAEEVNPHVKSIMRLPMTYSMGNNVHTFRAHGAIVNEHFSELGMEYGNRSPATADILRINHYVTKSRAECLEKTKRGRADTGEKHAEEFFESHDRNDVEDLRILELI